MELPAHGRATSVGDGCRLCRFPDHPPPTHALDTDALQRVAALVRRRDELLWELHREQVRLDMILRELVETEYAMAARSAPAAQWPMPTVPWSQDGWHRRASSVTREDAPHRQSSTCTEYPPCCCSSPVAARPPPVYPHVERSPSPIAPSGYQEYCRSPSEQTPTKEAFGPEMANASFRSMGSAFVHQEVTPEHKDTVGGKRKADLQEDGVQPLHEIRNQICGQRKAAETTMGDWLNKPGWSSCWDRPASQENAAFEKQKRLEFSELASEQSSPGIDAKQQQECRSSRETVQGMGGYLELCQPRSKQTLAEETLVPVVFTASIRPTRCSSVVVTPREQLELSGEPKVDVENGHGMPPLYTMDNQSSGQRKVEDSAMEAQIDRPLQSPCEYRPADLGNATYNEQNGVDLSESWPGRDAKQQECRSSGVTEHQMSRYLELCPSPSKQMPVDETLVPAIPNAIIRPTLSLSFSEEVAPVEGQKICGEPKVDVEDVRGVPPSYESRNQGNEQRKAVEFAMGARIDKPLQLPCQSKPAGQEDTASNEQKRTEFNEPTPERTSSALKRKLSSATPLPKKQKPLQESSSTFSHVNPKCQRNLDEQPAGRLRQLNIEALQATSKPAELNIKAMPGQSNSAKNWEPVRWDSKENVAENRGSRHHEEQPRDKDSEHQPSEDRPEPAMSRWTCRICNVKCSSASNFQDHLGGKRHRENTESILAEFRSYYYRMDADSEKNAYYCWVCSVRCTGDSILVSHLIGRRHREALQRLGCDVVHSMG